MGRTKVFLTEPVYWVSLTLGGMYQTRCPANRPASSQPRCDINTETRCFVSFELLEN